MTADYDRDSIIAVAQTPLYGVSSAAVWAEARIGPFATRDEAKAAAERMLAAEVGEEGR